MAAVGDSVGRKSDAAPLAAGLAPSQPTISNVISRAN